MATFLECLYSAHLFTTKEKTRYDLEYICCTPCAIYGTDGKKLYEGHPKDYPWKLISRNGVDDKSRTFFHALGMPKKPKDGEGYELKGSKLYALGTDWSVQSGVAFPTVDRILGMYDNCKYFPIEVNEWKRLIKARAQLCDPESGYRKSPKIVLIEQAPQGFSPSCRNGVEAQRADHKIIVKPAFPSDLSFTLTNKADQTAHTMKFDLDVWPWKCSPPLEVAMKEQTLLLRRGREAIKPDLVDALTAKEADAFIRSVQPHETVSDLWNRVTEFPHHVQDPDVRLKMEQLGFKLLTMHLDAN